MKPSAPILRFLVPALLLLAMLSQAPAQIFTNVPSGIAGLNLSSAVAGDFDNDGKIDVLLEGNGRANPATTIWRNQGSNSFGDFADLFQDGTDGVYQGSVAAADFFNIGKLDALVTGIADANYPTTQLWQNLGSGNFVTVANSGLPATANSLSAIGFDIAVGDFNNDGKMDVFLLGNGSSNGVIQLCQNEGNGIFVGVNSGITVSGNGGGPFPVLAADFDNDGYLDILVGKVLWRNLGNGAFTNGNPHLPGPVLAVGDFDNDGYLDVLISNGSYQIWRNLGNGTFTNTGAVLPSIPTPGGLFPAVAAVGDYDNDGYLDIVLATGSYTIGQTQIWRNLGNGSFTNIQSFKAATAGTLTWGDFNGDGCLDFLVIGQQGTDTNLNPVYVAQMWLNTLTNSNSPPTAPTNLTSQILGQSGVKLMWGAATDDHTPSTGLNYNLRIGSTSGGVDIVSPESDPITGQRRVVQIGNAQERLFSLLTNLNSGTYYWSVQAIDTAFAGGAFAPEATFTIPPFLITSSGFATNAQFQVTFNASAGASYTLQSSSNLTTWISVTNLIATTNAPAQLTDPNTAFIPQRYYRLSSP